MESFFSTLQTERCARPCLQNQRAGQRRCLRLHRAVLQPVSKTLRIEQPQLEVRHVREAGGSPYRTQNRPKASGSMNTLAWLREPQCTVSRCTHVGYRDVWFIDLRDLPPPEMHPVAHRDISAGAATKKACAADRETAFSTPLGGR
jgi:hypothetical protein